MELDGQTQINKSLIYIVERRERERNGCELKFHRSFDLSMVLPLSADTW